MKIIELKGTDLENDKYLIISNIKEQDIYFAYTGQRMLYEYIDDLKLSNPALCKLKIFRELAPICVSLFNNEKMKDYEKLSDLLAEIDIDKSCEVIVRGDLSGKDEDRKKTRTQLSDIMQQFVYLNIQLDRIHIMTEKEYEDSKKVKEFSKNIKLHEKNLQASVELISKEKFNSNSNIVEKVKSNLEEIKDYLKEAQENELKIAVAASKKSGKSMVVNSMLKCELAPTSLELATPNNCIYKKSYEGYTLEYSNEKKSFENVKALRQHIKEIFKDASMDKESGYAVPDMMIGYKEIDNGLSTYTIYDTPGPDLAGASGHKKAAASAIKDADVVIFSIDYTKHFTDTEVNYLNSIKEKFEKNHKYYSLIINVNKLDARYGNEGDKSVARILDYLRNKLISIAPEFRDSIVIGTSALTYFDCIEIEKLKEFNNLEEDGNLRDNIDALIEEWKYEESKSEEVTRLQFISTMLGNMKTFEGIKASAVEQVKRVSGMPNLLSYVEYIANEKARIEKVNSLIYKIDNLYTDIQNLFVFQRLEEELTNNQKKIEEVKAILYEFSQDIEKNFNKEYSEVSEIWEKDKNTFKSQSFKDEYVSNRKVFKWDYLIDYCREKFIEYYLNKNKIIVEIVDETVRGRVNDIIDNLFKESKVTRKIDKKDKTVVLEKKILEEFLKIPDIVSEDIGKKVTNKLSESKEQLRKEISEIKEDLAGIANKRIKKFDCAVKDCSEKLEKKGVNDFNILTTNFAFDFITSESNINKNILDESLKNNLKSNIGRIVDLNIKKNVIKNDKFHNIFDNILGIFKKDMYNEITYNKQALRDLYEQEISEDLKKELGAEGSNIEQICQELQDNITKDLSNEIDYFKNEMENQINNAISKKNEIERILDNTQEMEERRQEIEEKKLTLQKISNDVASFCDGWCCLRQEQMEV